MLNICEKHIHDDFFFWALFNWCFQPKNTYFDEKNKKTNKTLGKLIVWCLHFMLILKLLLLLLILDINTRTVETMQRKIIKYTRKRLNTPFGLTYAAQYSQQAKRRLPLKYILKEYKARKVIIISLKIKLAQWWKKPIKTSKYDSIENQLYC